MKNQKEILIENIYCGKTTEDYRPLYAKHSVFVRESKYKLYFEKINGKYRELITGTVITDVITDLKEAKVGVISLINPKPVEKKLFSKLQLKKGVINSINSIKLYKNQQEIRRKEEKSKIKIKSLIV